MNYKLIACINNINALGSDNKLLFNIKNDLANFKRMTINNVVIMGRKTYETLPFKPLPNRVNIILTRDKNFKAKNCYVVNSIEECNSLCEKLSEEYNDFYVIGGGKVYSQFLENDLVDTMYLTEVNDVSDGDTYFPSEYMDDNKWRLFYCSDTQKDMEHNLLYNFKIYKKVIIKKS